MFMNVEADPRVSGRDEGMAGEEQSGLSRGRIACTRARPAGGRRKLPFGHESFQYILTLFFVNFNFFLFLFLKFKEH